MAKLVKRSQQMLSLEETINRINKMLLELTHNLRELADQAARGEIDKETLNKKVVNIQKKYQSLADEKANYLEKLNRQQKSDADKSKMKEHGRFEFYNLILSYKLPRDRAVPVYMKVYEIVTKMAMGKGMERVTSYVVALSGSAPSESENYFQSNTPSQKMRNVHNSSKEVLPTSVGSEAESLLRPYAKSMKLMTQSAALDAQYPAFNEKDQNYIKREIQEVLNKLADEYKVEEEPEQQDQTQKP